MHLTSVHSALDLRIFYKECRSLARAGFLVTVIGPHSGDMISDDVHIKSGCLERIETGPNDWNRMANFNASN